MILDKALKKLQEKESMDFREYRKQISYLRLDQKDAEEVIKELKNRGIITLERNHRGSRVILKKKDV